MNEQNCRTVIEFMNKHDMFDLPSGKCYHSDTLHHQLQKARREIAENVEGGNDSLYPL